MGRSGLCIHKYVWTPFCTSAISALLPLSFSSRILLFVSPPPLRVGFSFVWDMNKRGRTNNYYSLVISIEEKSETILFLIRKSGFKNSSLKCELNLQLWDMCSSSRIEVSNNFGFSHFTKAIHVYIKIIKELNFPHYILL